MDNGPGVTGRPVKRVRAGANNCIYPVQKGSVIIR